VSYVIIWEFVIGEGRERAFEEAYGAEGAWAAMFKRSREYLGTELLADATAPRRYLTLDRWASVEAFEDFKREHRADYEALDARCEAWTESETRIGTWTVAT
jgi:heme-degrading monooxygenase HmoA